MTFMQGKLGPEMATCQGPSRDDLIRLLLPCVRRIANWHIRRAKFRSTMADDIYSAGLEGLVRGVDRYDPQRGEPKRFVERRIEGEIVDYLRSQDHLTRHFRDMAKASGIEPWSAPISLSAPIMISHVDRDRTLADVLRDECQESPEATAARREQVDAVERAARALPPRTRDILRRYYSDEANMVEIAEVYGLTESRVCQLLHEAHARIREALAVENPGGGGANGRGEATD